MRDGKLNVKEFTYLFDSVQILHIVVICSLYPWPGGSENPFGGGT